MQVLPHTPEALVQELDRLYPLRAPALTDSDREVWFKAGQRDVVDRLLLILSATRANNLETP